MVGKTRDKNLCMVVAASKNSHIHVRFEIRAGERTFLWSCIQDNRNHTACPKGSNHQARSREMAAMLMCATFISKGCSC